MDDTDILKDEPSWATTQPVDLSDLVETHPLVSNAPTSAIRNRAATSAILTGDPTNMVEKYRLLMQEGMEGKEVSMDEAKQAIARQNQTKSMKHVINILGDSSVPMDQKRGLMDFVRKGDFQEEPSVTLRTKALESASKGEDLRGESARISLADTLGKIEAEAQYRQRVINGLVADHPDVSAKTVVDMAQAEVMPFGRNIIAAKVASKFDELDGKETSPLTWLKRFALPGSTEAELQQRLLSVPPESRGPITDKIKEAIKESASVFPSENYYAQFKEAMTLLNSPTHDNAEIWAKNIGTLLDMFWVGSEAKALLNTSKAAQAAKEANAAYDASKGTGARRPGSAAPGVEDAPFEEVHKADWELVKDPTNPMQIGKPKDRIGTNPAPKLLEGPKDHAQDIQKRVELNAVVRRENPVSPYNIIEQSNPEQAKAMMTAIKEGGDEVAQAFTGVSREEAMANAVLPQIGTEGGSVLYKVRNALGETVSNTGATRYTAEEFDNAVANLKRDFRSASQLEINDAMTTFHTDGDHLIVDAHYVPAGGAFTTVEGARKQAEFSLRKYGIKDDEIIVMKRDGMDYVPITAVDAGKPGDFIVKVRAKVPVTDDMVESWNPLDVKRNITDRVSWTGSDRLGSAAGWLMDPASMLHPTLAGSMSVAADRAVVLENILLQPIKEFRDAVHSFDKATRAKIEDYIIEANSKGLKFDPYALSARGFNKEEIDALKQWKEIWDSHFYLENYDLTRTMNAQGYMLFENNKHFLLGKPVPKNQNITNIYDPTLDQVRTLTKGEMDALYNQGGHYAKLRNSVNINGVDVEHIMVRNTPQEFMRKLRDTDQVLNYRDGYFTVYYQKGAKFIDEISIDSAGKEVRRTVGVAGNTRDAENFRDSQQQITGLEHRIREDSKGFTKESDGYWDVQEANGRTAQRFRGAPLTVAQGNSNLIVPSYIENPMESVTRSAKSLADRTLMRTALETAKKRFVEQYGDFIKPDAITQEKYFPSSRNALVDHASHTSKEIADARTTFDYIHKMENGYINLADEIFKGGMNAVADILGKYGDNELAAGGEAIARKLSQTSPTHASKSIVYNAYIAASLPIRQWVVQGHQATRMIAYNPIGIAGMTERFGWYLGQFAGVAPKSKAAQEFNKFVEDSGMLAGVDRNSLVRGMGLAMADSENDLKRALGAVASAPQRFGFDIGERFNMLGHLIAVHEKWTRIGKNLADKTIRDLAYTEARALSYDLNRAGELDYTQASLGSTLQFLQMPQKAWLQLTNRKIDWQTKARLFVWDTVMWGAPTTAIGTLMSIGLGGDSSESTLPADPIVRDRYKYGMESWGFNYMINKFLDEKGEKSRVDFSALSPYDMDGWTKMWHAFLDEGFMAMLAASPTGQMFAVNGVNNSKRNGRIPQAIITLGRYMNVFDEIDPDNPTEFTSVLNDVAKITSGWTAIDNAKIALEARKKVDSLGRATDETVTLGEAVMAFGGFGTQSTKELYEITRNIDNRTKEHQQALEAKYRDILTYYKNSLGTDNNDLQHTQKVTSMLLRTFSGEDLLWARKQWQKDMAGKEIDLTRKMMKAAGVSDNQGLADDIRLSQEDPRVKELMLQRMKERKQIEQANIKQ